MLSHGYLSRLVMLLSWVRESKVKNMQDYRVLSRCNRDESYILEKMSSDLQLLRITHGPALELTERGLRVVSKMPDNAACFRDLIAMYIRFERPGWAYRIPAGRQEAYAMMNKDLRFCFRAAGLMQEEISDDVLTWWDEMSQELRGNQSERRVEIGRVGERLTIQYEYSRVGRQPIWKSVESNLVGYDVLSIAEAEDETPRLIEVKSSKAGIDWASMKITSNERETACISADRYFFYLWLLGERPRLAILTQGNVKPHIAENQGSGTWEVVEVPFRAFATSFVDVNIKLERPRMEICRCYGSVV